jgi:hypothetical protein
VYEWAPSAAKHGIARHRILHVVVSAPRALPFLDEHGEAVEGVFLFLGDDPSGVPLEVIARIGDDGTVLVFHAMKMRQKYRHLYEQDRG